jgi:glycosyltransferase involved in cell wall biosynthesis
MPAKLFHRENDNMGWCANSKKNTQSQLLTDHCGFDEVETVGGGRVVHAATDALADGLVSMLENRHAMATMGERLKNHVRQNYSWKVIAERYLDLFQRFPVRHGGEEQDVQQ